MSEQITESTARVFIQVLEDLAMMFGDHVETKDVTQSADDYMAVEIDFRGAGEGTIKLLAAPAMAVEVAASILGLELDDPEAKEAVSDAIGELLNVVVGQLLTETCGTEAVFDLSAPKVRTSVPSSEWEELLDHGNTVAIEVEDSPVLLSFTLRDETLLEGGSSQ